MKSRPELVQRVAVPRASLAIDNLRAVVIVLVLAFHSVLAYLNYLPPHPFAFDVAGAVGVARTCLLAVDLDSLLGAGHGVPP